MLFQIIIIDNTPPQLYIIIAKEDIQIKKERICSYGNYGAGGLGCYDLFQLLKHAIAKFEIYFVLESIFDLKPFDFCFSLSQFLTVTLNEERASVMNLLTSKMSKLTSIIEKNNLFLMVASIASTYLSFNYNGICVNFELMKTPCCNVEMKKDKWIWLQISQTFTMKSISSKINSKNRLKISTKMRYLLSFAKIEL